MSYQKNPSQQYSRKKPFSWVAGYQNKGQYRLLRSGRPLPKSVESVDLIVPVRPDLQLPVDVKVEKQFSSGGAHPEKRLLVHVSKEGLRNFDLWGNPIRSWDEKPQSKAPKTPTEYDQQIDLIRRAVKKLCPTLSVRRGSGTAYSWIEINAGEKNNYRSFTDQENQALKDFGLSPGGNSTGISPEDRKFYVEKAKQVLGI